MPLTVAFAKAVGFNSHCWVGDVASQSYNKFSWISTSCGKASMSKHHCSSWDTCKVTWTPCAEDRQIAPLQQAMAPVQRVVTTCLQIDVACMPTQAGCCPVSADVKALAQAQIVDLLPACARPDQQPLLVDGHVVAAASWHLHLHEQAPM